MAIRERLAGTLKGYPPWRTLVDRVKTGAFPLVLAGPRGAYLALLIAELSRRTASPLLIIVATEQEAELLRSDLSLFDCDAMTFPWWGSMPYRPLPRTAPVFGNRTRSLGRMATGEARVVIASLRAYLTPVPDPARFRERLRWISTGGSFDPAELGRTLERYGYSRVAKVSVRGEYAVRGEVVDLIQPGDESGTRIVFEFDEIDEIREFDPSSQGSIRKIDRFLLHPEREVVWADAEIASAVGQFSSMSEFRKLPELTEQLEQQRWADGEEIYFPFADATRHYLPEYLGEEAITIFTDTERLTSSHEALAKEYQGLFTSERVRRDVPRPNRFLLSFSEACDATRRRIDVPLLNDTTRRDAIRLPSDPPRSFFGNVAFFREELQNHQQAGYDVIVVADSDAQASRIRHLLAEFDLMVVTGRISGGFGLPDQKLIVVEENEIFGRRKRVPKSVKQVHSQAIDTFIELAPGDHVVHVNYGIGKFIGIRRIAAAGNERDYIHLEYADQEFIYTPIEQVNLVQRYIGSSGDAPRLDKIGGKSWESRKSRVRKNVEDLAERLVKLYSRRRRARGFAFPADTEWQMQFEATFPYEETPDQLTCIEEVKADMERPQPMDRLVCGDVGYGKTEIALRAAFKAVTAGKQVAILTPTTILTEQHYENFTERLVNFPVRAGMLSRFVPPKEQKRVINALAGGELDIVIGTHRLLQKDVMYKDLGLLIIDEEQRFGVKDKERIKELKTSVDSLTLTATPIPRTLHMSLLKIRDMSILKTPPQNRLPIETVIQEFNPDVVARAIRTEIDRGGQVYFLHNRVETLDSIVSFIQELVPEVFVDKAHGQMSSTELEDIMHRFIHGSFQVLVATTIIENGIDIPNVNTIIIDRADIYGISQLYQLRGRVGRSDRLAYAYLFYPDQRVLSEVAMKRLQIISDYTELGSGFKIALKDLEVRGAGNLLGREQSGDILSVGFDLYLKLLDEAIRRLDDTEAPADEEVYLELQYSGFIPDSYVNEPVEKMEVYKKIASIGTEQELEAIAGELQDRFGPLPEEVQSLLSLAEIRVLCKTLRIASLRERGGTLEIEFAKVARISADRVVGLIQASGGTVRLDPKRPHVLVMDTASVGLREKSEFIRGRLSTLVA
ncbi:MAG: transcription-repair coupling factor [Spirochaetaceae bacterium]|nr:MAG: transcription-repair coupling factor [Spirochaetaceae bacterium]